jgi:hypothetical protein
MKIDVEGAELDVLVGATQFIERVQPRAIFLEVIDSHLRKFGASSQQVIDFLRERGYDLEGLVRGRWRLILNDCPMDADIVARRRSNNLGHKGLLEHDDAKAGRS